MNRQNNDLDIYIRLRPEVVARIWDDPAYGAHAAMKRWFWVGHSTLAKIAMEGRVTLRRQAGAVGRSSAARSATPEQEDALVEAVQRLASIDMDDISLDAISLIGRCVCTFA